MSSKTKQDKKLVRLIAAISDMEQSIDAASALLAGAPTVLFDHLFLSMVVSYGRPFTENKGVGCIMVDYPDYPEFLDEEMVLRHRRLVDLRNKFLAHSSSEGVRVQVIPPGISNPLTSKSNATFDFNVGRRKFPDLQYVKWLLELPLAFKKVLHADILRVLKERYGPEKPLNAPFEILTGYEAFKWT